MICRRREGEERLEILKVKFSFENDKFKFLMFERFGERAPQHREKYFAFQHSRGRSPIDIEVGCVGGLRTIFEHVHPPRVFAASRHVIWNNVENQPHTAPAQRFPESEEIDFGTKLWIQASRVGYVITVAAAVPRSQDRRSVDMGDSKISQVIDDLRRILKRKILVELQAICRE